MTQKYAILHRMKWQRFMDILSAIECWQKFRA
jgi:hypothetical protein